MVHKREGKEMIDFKEFVVSKKQTLDVVLKHFIEVYNETNPKKGRLLIDG